MRGQISMLNRASALAAAGVLGQVDGSHLPPSISGMLIAGGMAMIAMEYVRSTPRHERIADLEHSLLDP